MTVARVRPCGAGKDPVMTTTPEHPVPDDDLPPPEGAPGAEIGITEGEGSTFEPEEG